MSTRTDEQRLQLFSQRVDRLLQRRAIVDKTLRAYFQIRFENGKTTITRDGGDEEDVRSFLLDLRLFMLNDEDINFGRIANIIERRIRDDELRAAMRRNRAAWKQTMAGRLIVHVDGKNYAAKDCFDLVVNGELFHLDADKAAEFTALDPVFREGMLTEVNALALNAARVLYATRNLIRQALAQGLLDFTTT